MKKSVIIVALFLLAAAFVLFPSDKKPAPIEKIQQAISGKTSLVTWDYDEGNKWASSSASPECPTLEFESPVGVDKVTSVLYPGQYRGEDGGYRVHGGFRFDKQTSTQVDVRAPFDAYVFRGSRYLVGGQLQYVFDFINSCGIMYRLGHLYKLTPQMQELADKFPQPKEGDSRDHRTERLELKKGDLIATDVGLPGNVFVDWGVYDLRQENEASKNADYRSKHGWFSYLSFHGICWLDYLPSDQETVLKNLPCGDGQVGKQSDYCI